MADPVQGQPDGVTSPVYTQAHGPEFSFDEQPACQNNRRCGPCFHDVTQPPPTEPVVADCLDIWRDAD